MRSTEFHRSHEEAPCGARNELLNPKSRVRIPPPAPKSQFGFGSRRHVTAAAYSQMYCQARMHSRRPGEAQGGDLPSAHPPVRTH